MSKRSAIFRQADLSRALEGVKKAGLDVARVEIDPSGKIIVVAGKPERVSANNEWDAVE
jgi:hypothetical protein